VNHEIKYGVTLHLPISKMSYLPSRLVFISELRYYGGSSYEDFYILECDAV
jgi:hypothetical protein